MEKGIRKYSKIDLLRFVKFAEENADLKPIELLKAYDTQYPELSSKEKLINSAKGLRAEGLYKALTGEDLPPINQFKEGGLNPVEKIDDLRKEILESETKHYYEIAINKAILDKKEKELNTFITDKRYEATKNLSCALCGYFCNNDHHYNNWFDTTKPCDGK